MKSRKRSKSNASAALVLLREELGVTQAGLAAMLNVSLPTVGRWESWSPPGRIRTEMLARFALRHQLPEIAQLFRTLNGEKYFHRCPLCGSEVVDTQGGS